jgi:hypothetical protein
MRASLHLVRSWSGDSWFVLGRLPPGPRIKHRIKPHCKTKKEGLQELAGSNMLTDQHKWYLHRRR